MRRKGFTLVELMTVVAILAVLYAVLMPVVLQVKSYAQQYVAGESLRKLGQCTTMYMGDSDDTFPLAYYPSAQGRQNWFGLLDQDKNVVPGSSIIAPYIKGKIQPDWSFNGLPWQGDITGFGYNWGYLGSDFYESGGISTGAACTNPATSSALKDPSETVEYGTSSFYYAKWIPKGDGLSYRFGFIDPPKFWFGNPTLDFRHGGDKTVDAKKREVNSTGVALLVFADGHMRPAHQGKISTAMFTRQGSGVIDTFGEN